MVGLPELIVLIILLIIIIAAIMSVIHFFVKPTRLISWFRRLSEAPYFRNQSDSIEKGLKHDQKQYIPLKYGLIVTFIISLLPALMFLSYFNLPPAIFTFVQTVIIILLNGIAFLCVSYSVYLHFTPNTDRKKKYQYLLIGVSSTTTTSIAYVTTYFIELFSGIHQYSPGNVIGHGIFLLVLSLMTQSFVILVVGCIASWIIRPWAAKPGVVSSRLILRAYRIVKALAIPLCVVGSLWFILTALIFVYPPFFGIFAYLGMIVYPSLLTYLLVRYVLLERLSRTPILYLRSFRYADGPAAFGRIVNRVASCYGAVATIVHSTQKGSLLSTQIDITEQASMVTLADRKWQEWIAMQLKCCAAALIDKSIETDSLQWEIDTARELLDPSRIAILHQKGMGPTRLPGIWTLEYELDRKKEKEAREALKLWFESSVFGSA